MKWTITKTNIQGAIGAGPNQQSSEKMTQSFALSGMDGAAAEGEASADTTALDILPWATGMYGLSQVSFGELKKVKEEAKP